MPRGRCWIEKDLSGNVIRIFKSPGAAAASKAGRENRIAEFPRVDAVRMIREQVFIRSNHECEYCGGPINYKFHMHEKIHRGQGGEISLENCVALCAKCHLQGEHGDRQPRFGESNAAS